MVHLAMKKAAQGLLRISAARGEPFVLRRDEAYIGVLIDDLVTKGVGGEPYRMFSVVRNIDYYFERIMLIAFNPKRAGLESSQKHNGKPLKEANIENIKTLSSDYHIF